MTVNPYKIVLANATRYEFNSLGPKGVIKKGVEITALDQQDTYNFGFGDVRPDGTIDDQTETNNEDIIRVFATVIEIMKDYIKNNPNATLYFDGSTDQRMLVYQYIVKRYHDVFTENFIITGILGKENGYQEVIYDPQSEEHYLAFLVQKKS